MIPFIPFWIGIFLFFSLIIAGQFQLHKPVHKAEHIDLRATSTTIQMGTVRQSYVLYYKDKKALIRQTKENWRKYGRNQKVDYVQRLSLGLTVPNGQEFTCSAKYVTYDDIPDTDVYCGEHYGTKYYLIKYWGKQ